MENFYLLGKNLDRCEILVGSGKGHACSTYRSTLRTMYNRWVKNKARSPTTRISSSSRINNRWLSSPEIITRMKDIQRRMASAERQIEHLKKKLGCPQKNRGVVVDDQLSDDLSHLVREQTPKVAEEFPAGSFQRLFWEHQN